MPGSMKPLLPIVIFTLASIITYGQGEPISEVYAHGEIRTELQSLVNKMEDYGRIDSRAIGFEGKYTEQYSRFIKLSEKATDDELLILTEHKHAAIRGYAFWALAKRHYQDLHMIYIKHRDD